MLRQDIESMKRNIQNAGDDVSRIFNPFIESLTNELQLAIDNQKNENIHLQNQIMELKKEKTLLQMMIIKANQTAESLEEQVGNYD